jgi:hypothetical protein
MLRFFSAALVLTLAARTAAAESTFSIVSENSSGGSAVQGMSANGSVVVGVSDGQVFRWTPDRGLTYISPKDFLPRFRNLAQARLPS